jgi:hypothetical protein
MLLTVWSFAFTFGYAADLLIRMKVNTCFD